MDKVLYVILGATVAVILGTAMIYSIESKAPNSQINTPLDALWWCISTVTTVGYGDIVPVTTLGRIVALVYMGFGITIISLLLSVISSNFYKRRIENEELLRKETEDKYLRNLLLNKISNIEENQNHFNEVVNKLYRLLSENDENKKKI